jgi:hypothetical protein
VVIGFAASVRTAAAQYIPPQPPPLGYPPPAYYSYRDYLPPVHYGYEGYPPPAYYRANPSEPFQGRDETQMRKATVMNTTDLTRQGECLAMCRAGSDQGL